MQRHVEGVIFGTMRYEGGNFDFDVFGVATIVKVSGIYSPSIGCLLGVGVGQRSSGQTNDRIGGLEQTGGGVVPGEEGGHQTQSTTNPGHNVASGQMSQVGRGQEEEGQDEDKEHGRQAHGRAQGRDPQDEGEDAPREQKDAQGVIEGVIRSVGVAGHDAESGDQDRGVGEPERTIGANPGGWICTG